MRRLAAGLLRLEGKTGSGDSPAQHAQRVCAKLGITLTNFAGPAGFESLLGRALALARMEFPELEAVRLEPGGVLEGLDAVTSEEQSGGSEAAVGIIAHLLGLLATFIGEALTMRLVCEAWPDASWDE